MIRYLQTLLAMPSVRQFELEWDPRFKTLRYHLLKLIVFSENRPYDINGWKSTVINTLFELRESNTHPKGRPIASIFILKEWAQSIPEQTETVLQLLNAKGYPDKTEAYLRANQKLNQFLLKCAHFVSEPRGKFPSNFFANIEL